MHLYVDLAVFLFFYYSLTSKNWLMRVIHFKNRTTLVEQFVFWFTNKSRFIRFVILRIGLCDIEVNIGTNQKKQF